MPGLGTLKVTGVDMNSTAGDGSEQARVKSPINELLFAGGYPVNGIPSTLKIELRNFAVALPSKSDADGLKELIALGYTNVDMSFLLTGGWSEQTNDLMIRELSLRGVEMADLSLTGTIGNVSKDIFDPDQAVASVALMASRIKALDVTINNKGLYERFLAKTAKEEEDDAERLARRPTGWARPWSCHRCSAIRPRPRGSAEAMSRGLSPNRALSLGAKVKDPGGDRRGGLLHPGRSESAAGQARDHRGGRVI